MPELIICDTSCLILFEKIKQLHLLAKCYSDVFVTVEIADEFGNMLPSEIKIKTPSNKVLQQALSHILGKGEASAIALSVDYSNSLIAIDDLKARKIAKSLNIPITGSLGILIKAKQTGIIPALSPILSDIQKTDFRVSSNIIQKVLTIVGEL